MDNNMSIIIRCNCGNLIELKSNKQGHQISLNDELNNKFSTNNLDVNLDGELEEIEDLSDVDVELGSIRINCNKCGDYIVIDDYFQNIYK